MNIINPFKLIVILIFLLSPIFAKAQVPTVQDCLGAIPICQETYSEVNAYQNTGNYPDEIDSGPSCLGSGEKNDVWYIFTVQASGTLNFSITPNTMSDDYDWAVYDLTNHVCSDIFTTPSIEVSCNYSGTPGITGPNGFDGAQNEPTVDVTAGDIYVINVSQYENNSQDGYTIDFGSSTANIYDDISPTIQSVNAKEYCDSTVITCHFSENILCNTINVGSFDLIGPGGPFIVEDVTSESCELGAQYGIDFKIHFDHPLRYGPYTLYMPDQADGNITDNCGNEAVAGQANFTTSGGYDMTLNNQDMPCHDLEDGEIHATIPETSETVWYAFDYGTGTLGTYNPANGDQTNLPAGTYMMSAKVGETIDQYSCKSDTTIIIENPPEAFATVGNDTTLCSLPEYILTGITSPVGTGTWTSTSTNVTFTNEHLSNAKAKHIPYGTTTFTWTVDNGICGTFVDDLNVTLYPSNTIAGDDNGTCELTTLQLDGNNPFPGTGIWTCNTPTITFDNVSLYNATASNISGGSHTFTWTTDYEQCGTLSDEVTISNSSPPTAAHILGVDEEICAEQKNLSANPVVIGQGLWTSDENSIIIDNTNSSSQATVIPAGINHFYWTVSNGFCPPSNDTIIITRYEEPSISSLAADTIICEENTFLQGNPPTIGIGTWTVTNSSVISNATLYDSEAILPLGAATFTWTITNGVCPPSIDNIIITREASLTLPLAGEDFEICENYTSLNSNIPSVGTGFWQATGGGVIIENSLSNQTNIANLANGENSFIWTIYSPNCHAISDTVIVLSGDFNPPIAQVNDIEAECSVNVPIPTANDACEGSISGTTTSSLFYNQQGTYSINWVFDDGNGNTSNQIQTIRVNDITEPEISCTKDTTVYADTLTENYITNVGVLMPAEYSDNCTISSIINDYNNTDSIGIVSFNIGDYIITWTATDANNNEKTCEFVYHVIPDERDYADCDNDGIPNYLDEDNCTIIVPEAFSPDGNGKNDVLKIKGLVSYPNHVVTIYNRWGNKVYEASPYNNDWDGRNMFGIGGNEKLPNGTYFYIIETGMENEKPVTGCIFLIK